MKALCYHGPRDLRFDEVADARIEDERDIVVKMRCCGICGSDLHIFHGMGFNGGSGYSVGHEAVGEVVEVGSGVRRLKAGQRVMLSAAVGCGECQACVEGRVLQCSQRGAATRAYGIGMGLAGCQAEAIRVPAADFNATPVPEGLTDEQALMLTDNLPTAWMGCLNANIEPGCDVLVLGLGPIGLMAVEAAYLLGAARIFAVDPVAERRAMACLLGAQSFVPEEAQVAIETATHGRMAHCAVDAAGTDRSLLSALQWVGRGGTVSVIGVGQSESVGLPIRDALRRNLSLRMGVCSVPQYWPALVPLVQAGRLQPQRYITNALTLQEGAEAYALFDSRQAGTLKVVMTPGT